MQIVFKTRIYHCNINSQVRAPCHNAEYCLTKWTQHTVQREIFTGPDFRKNPVSPPEEIFAVLIFAFSASASYWQHPFIIAGLTEDKRSPVRDGRTLSASHCQIEWDYSAQNACTRISTSPNVHAKVHVLKFSRFLFLCFGRGSRNFSAIRYTHVQS